MSKYFIAVLVPQHDDRWRAHFPDLPGCRAEGERVETATHRAAEAAHHLIGRMREKGEALPEPRTLEDIYRDVAWAKERDIDWSKAVVSIVPVRYP
jgi:predicted RNase H-like HicB family nuclease